MAAELLCEELWEEIEPLLPPPSRAQTGRLVNARNAGLPTVHRPFHARVAVSEQQRSLLQPFLPKSANCNLTTQRGRGD